MASSFCEESINEEMSNPSRWPNEELESSHFSDTSSIRSVGFYGKIKNLFDSHLPLSWFLAVAFLGFWLPKKRYSLWLLTLIPAFLLQFGVGAHLYFMVTSLHRSIHIGSKMLLSTLWISGFAHLTFSPANWYLLSVLWLIINFPEKKKIGAPQSQQDKVQRITFASKQIH